MSVRMNRIVLHHTGGGHTASATDLAAYHRLVEGSGRRISGRHAIAANAPGRTLRAGQYAAHVRGLNSGSIGVSMCAMGRGQWATPKASPFFPEEKQVQAFVQEIADLCVEYSIPVTRRTVLTHAEVEIVLGVEQAGKWDYDYDPFGKIDSRDPLIIGDLIRDAVDQEIKALGGRSIPTAASPRRTLRRGHTGDDVKELQRLLNDHLRMREKLVADGAFGPKTFDAVVQFQAESQLLVDGIVGRMTWTALLEGER